MTLKPKIVTHYDPKPIPHRYFDWCAWRDGELDLGYRCGYGSTGQIAIDDLLEHEAEAEDDAAYARWCEDESRRDDAREGFDDL